MDAQEVITICREARDIAIDEPPALVRSLAQQSGKSVAEVEKLWDEAKKAAEEAGRTPGTDKFFGLATTILKNKLGIE